MDKAADLQIINYGGIFLSCFSESDTKDIDSLPVHYLNYVLSGEQVIQDGAQSITISAGEAVFVRRNHRTKIIKKSKDGQPYRGISLVFERSILRDFYQKLDKATIPQDTQMPDENFFKIWQRPEIMSLFESLTPYFNSNIKPSDAVINLKLLEGIYGLLSISDIYYRILFDFANPWKVDILEFLNDNYMDELSMEQIAIYTGRSLATFKRDFKKISNLSPQKWLIKKRLETAYFLLKDQKRKVMDVYAEVGFKNPSHFSTVFKKQYGMPPTEI
ncbi:helix-turn-helix domain-containing protein [Flavobacterium pectinovorum]|uniref:AraC family transcriptional regulator n=1 Tax=Flavobacterium pectinovorum TaxID=29533 RepID=A0AB36P6E2_9FLAO|nr:AraC family transcriptional regulator [Flavobacterium pectinovorum]OXB07744.1 AraC family transcriptional regulator [Flavobacterium pectinovorum]SHM78964.1 AraC-type DNA-binding protein [Flavobacterium pectinovorum]